MSQIRIASIVEGDGEVAAVPVLLRRHANRAGWSGRLLALPPIRQPASRLLKPGQLERIVELAIRKLGVPGGIFVLLDCDDACPAELGPRLLTRVLHASRGFPACLVLAHREYEAWFLGAASSIAGKRNLPDPLQPHPQPESVRGCKEWLSRQMPRGAAYNEVEDQPALTEEFDFDLAKSACSSFEKCDRELMGLLQRVALITPGFHV
jgi:hypothetical protein